jgi:hypothetical protein
LSASCNVKGRVALLRAKVDVRATGAPVQLKRIAHGPKATFAEQAGRESKP